MGMVQGSRESTKAERAFTQALHAYEGLPGLGVQTKVYLDVLSSVVSSCQEAISLERQHDEAHILLANAFYLLHLTIHPTTQNKLPLQLAAATIQHWCDQPAAQPPRTRDAERGCNLYQLIARALSEMQPECADCEEREMRCLEAEYYSRALVARPYEWIAA